MTQAGIWTERLAERLNCRVFRHCKGGLGMRAIVDGGIGAEGTLPPLSPDIVRNMDLIIFYAGYNDRGLPDSRPEDGFRQGNRHYPGDGPMSGLRLNDEPRDTIAGLTEYCIRRIYAELLKASNPTCRLLLVTPHCAGRYPYIDADGYEEYPAGSGRTMESMADTIKQVAQRNQLPVCDLWHNSGINRYTWNVYGASSTPVCAQYSPFLLDSRGNPISEQRITYITGKRYYQKRGNKILPEEYTGTVPYPYNADQLHASVEGYHLIGDVITGAVLSAYGN